MARKPKHIPALPTKEQLLEFINESPTPVGKREIARAFHIKGDMRAQLRSLLKELEQDGSIDRGHKKRVAARGALPEVSIIEIVDMDLDGELSARPTGGEHADEIKILVTPSRRAGAAPKPGDRVLARLRRLSEFEYEAQPIRILKPGARKVLGILEEAKYGCTLRPTDRKNNREFKIAPSDLKDAGPGQLVLAEPLPGKAMGPRPARVVEVIGAMTDPKAYSLIAIHEQGIPVDFREEVLAETEKLKPAALGKRTDLREFPLVTIDGADARDFDDAVWAEPDSSQKNEGGWHLLVAIADVSHYVTFNSALDRSAIERGNSVYFPDRVVPMLPERLSNDLCSLRPNEDRACMAVHMWIDKNGKLLRHEFVRGLMRSAARLTYEQVQKVLDGFEDETASPLEETVIKPLFGAFQALNRNREARGTLELDIPETRVILGEDGQVSSISKRERLDSHKLIEEFMITANVAAAEALEKKKRPVMYRVHDAPSMEKMEALRESLDGLGYKLAKGSVIKPHHFTGILAKAAGTEKAELISSIILRSQAQAIYSPDNLGHFGLALRSYAHFTSPIRRYSDLLVHRALISAFGLGKDGLSDEQAHQFEETGEAISITERRAAVAEREATERYITAFMADRIGATFSGKVNGVTRFGLFVTLDETRADGLVPVSTLPDDRYFHDEVSHALVGQHTGLTYTLGEPVKVKLAEADKVTGGMVFRIVDGGKFDMAARKNARRHNPKKGRKSPRHKGKRR